MELKILKQFNSYEEAETAKSLLTGYKIPSYFPAENEVPFPIVEILPFSQKLFDV